MKELAQGALVVGLIVLAMGNDTTTTELFLVLAFAAIAFYLGRESRSDEVSQYVDRAAAYEMAILSCVATMGDAAKGIVDALNADRRADMTFRGRTLPNALIEARRQSP